MWACPQPPAHLSYRPAAHTTQAGSDVQGLVGGNPDMATQVFNYLIVPGPALTTAALLAAAGTNLTTLGGDQIEVTSDGQGCASFRFLAFKHAALA